MLNISQHVVFGFVSLSVFFHQKYQRKRIVAIHQYEGTTCDETAIHPDEDITLFRQVFGHEFLGAGSGLLYDVDRNFHRILRRHLFVVP